MPKEYLVNILDTNIWNVTQIDEAKLKFKKQLNQRNIVPPEPTVRVAPYSYLRDQAKGLHPSWQDHTGRRCPMRISTHVLDRQQGDNG